MDKVTAEQCKQVVRETGLTWLGHHRCGGCNQMVGYSFEQKSDIHPDWQQRLGVERDDIIVMFNPMCGCNDRGQPEPRSWGEFAETFNMQTPANRTEMWERFKAGKATHESD